jgi:hypothetical protein
MNRLTQVSRALLGDVRGAIGQVGEGVLGTTLTFSICFGVFLLNVEIGQLSHDRDAVDHSAAIATNVAKQTYCAKEENSAAVVEDARRAIKPVIETAGKMCEVDIASKGESGDPGSRALSVSLDCTFDCAVPFASQILCKGGKMNFKAKLTTVSMGCDGKGSKS